jgi:23S rRNA (uracil1939-C5)-methyltransferase
MQHPEGLERNALGFHIPGMYDKVFAVSECWLQPEPSNKIRNFIYEYAIRERLSFFDLKAQTGLLRSLIIRTSATGEVMVIVSFYEDHPEKREALLLELHKTFPEITSLLYAINTKGNDTLTDQNILTFKGKDHIMENMDGLSFKVGPKSFYQTNSLQAAELYRLVKEFAALTGKETVYDLYSGTGTIALYVAGSCKKVIGIEYVPEAIEDACINMELNKISNALFFAGDIRRVMDSAFVRKHGLPDLIITDPPRSGMHEDVITAILEVAPEKIVYVSCNPATQARDLALMSVHYQIEKIRPVDMFPHTHHVENVVLLVKRTN